MMTPVMPALTPPSGQATRPAGRGRGEDFAAALAAEEEAIVATTAQPSGAAEGAEAAPDDVEQSPEGAESPVPGEDGAAELSAQAAAAGMAPATEAAAEQPAEEGGRGTQPRTAVQQPQAHGQQAQGQGQGPTQGQLVQGQSVEGQQTQQVPGQQQAQSAHAAQLQQAQHAQQGQAQQGQAQPASQQGEVAHVQGQAPDQSGRSAQVAPTQAEAAPQQAPGPQGASVPVAGVEPAQPAPGKVAVGPQMPVDAQQSSPQPAGAQAVSTAGVEASVPGSPTPSTATSAAPSAPATPASGAPTQPQPPPLGNQLAASMARLQTAPNGHHVLNIRVDPEDLGPVRVSAHIGTDGVRIELFGMTESARDALRGALADLRRELAATGLQADLDLGSEDAPSEESGPRTSGQPADPRPAAVTTTDTPTPVRTAPFGGSSLDLLA